MIPGFYVGMKVSLNNEFGVVIEPKRDTFWDEEPGIIRWDTNRDSDEEDWRGLYSSFIDSGGKEISSSYIFRYINDNGELKNRLI